MGIFPHKIERTLKLKGIYHFPEYPQYIIFVLFTVLFTIVRLYRMLDGLDTTRELNVDSEVDVLSETV